MPQVRTRFAPSPTGEIHVGNLRVAVFNHLFARRHDGAFVLRIEDTDAERTVEGSLGRLQADLSWAGIAWDEGPDIGGPFEPYVQSQRQPRHSERAAELLSAGLAYRCFCGEDTPETEIRDSRQSRGCAGGCRNLSPDQASARAAARSTPPALRFAVPDSIVHIMDYVRGSIRCAGKDISDFIILRRDGRATYNFAAVVDDADMKITHVIRGAGHLSNTPKQALLFDALGSNRPVFAHLPTVLTPDGVKLSKRTGAPGVGILRKDGLHPEGVVNYLSLLGWSPRDDTEVFSREELVERLDLDGVGSSNTSFDPDKMRWMSAQHIARMSLADLSAAVEPFIDSGRFPLGGFNLPLAVDAVRSRLHAFGEINGALALLFPLDEALERARGQLATEGEQILALLNSVRARIGLLEPWSVEGVTVAIREAGKELGLRGPAVFHPLRLALCGDRSGPDLGKVMAAVGRERVAGRLTEAIARLSAG